MTEAKNHGGRKIFLLEYEKEEKELILTKALPLRGGKKSKVYHHNTPSHCLPFSYFLCLLSKLTWANIAGCHIKAIPCIFQRGTFRCWIVQLPFTLKGW